MEPLDFTLKAIETPLFKLGVEYNEGARSDNSNSFIKTLDKAMNNMKDVHNRDNNLVTEYAAGGEVEISEVMVAMEKASVATELAIQIRNKMVEGFKELTKMQM